LEKLVFFLFSIGSAKDGIRKSKLSALTVKLVLFVTSSPTKAIFNLKFIFLFFPAKSSVRLRKVNSDSTSSLKR
jgi:hypothetical protein